MGTRCSYAPETREKSILLIWFLLLSENAYFYDSLVCFGLKLVKCLDSCTFTGSGS